MWNRTGFVIHIFPSVVHLYPNPMYKSCNYAGGHVVLLTATSLFTCLHDITQHYVATSVVIALNFTEYNYFESD